MTTHPQYGLLLIDIQPEYYYPPNRGRGRLPPDFEENIHMLLFRFRTAGKPRNIFHVHHHPVLPNSPLHSVHRDVAFPPYATPQPDEQVFDTVDPAFFGTDLQDAIREREITDLIIAGLTIDYFLKANFRTAANLGLFARAAERRLGRILLVGDATAIYGRTVEEDAMMVPPVVLSLWGSRLWNVIPTMDLVREMDFDS